MASRHLFIQSNPQYEQMEGIAAGTPSLRQYDIILDAGTSAAEGVGLTNMGRNAKRLDGCGVDEKAVGGRLKAGGGKTRMRAAPFH